VLNDNVRHTLFRTAQEGLTNIQRHAQASQAWVRLSRVADAIILCVGDNGIGMPTNTTTGHFGLRGLDERAADLGGHFRISPRPDGGTQLEMSLPISPNTEHTS
jgi:signal transduction histidine kinase